MYPIVHATIRSHEQPLAGMDIKHRLTAQAALTLGKDMTWRDYAQGGKELTVCSPPLRCASLAQAGSTARS